MIVAYTFFAFSTVVGFKGNVNNLSPAAIPFISVAKESAAVVLAVIYATVLVGRDPGTGDRVGSIVADE